MLDDFWNSGTGETDNRRANGLSFSENHAESFRLSGRSLYAGIAQNAGARHAAQNFGWVLHAAERGTYGEFAGKGLQVGTQRPIADDLHMGLRIVLLQMRHCAKEEFASLHLHKSPHKQDQLRVAFYIGRTKALAVNSGVKNMKFGFGKAGTKSSRTDRLRDTEKRWCTGK